jgi:hypothetical protein
VRVVVKMVVEQGGDRPQGAPSPQPLLVKIGGTGCCSPDLQSFIYLAVSLGAPPLRSDSYVLI